MVSANSHELCLIKKPKRTKNNKICKAVVVHFFNPSTQEADLYEFENSLVYNEV